MRSAVLGLAIFSGAIFLMTAAMADGSVFEMRAGDLFYIPPEPHDSWVVGDEPYVSLHFMGAEKYAAGKKREQSPSL